MSILFLLRLWPVYGGGESVTRLLANEFISMGHDVHVAYFKYSTCNTQPAIDSRIQQHHIENVPCDEYTSNDIEDTHGVNETICDIINRNSIDVVINQWFPRSYIKDIKQKTNAKVIWCLHTILAQPFEKPKNFTKWLKYTLFPNHYKNRLIHTAVNNVEASLPYVDKYVFLSDAYKQQFMSWSNSKDKDKIAVIPNPIPFQYSISEPEIKGKENIVLVVGRMQEVTKKYSNVIKAWRLFERGKDPLLDNWKLVMVGDGESLDEYKKMAEQYKLTRITFEGFQSPIDYYRKAKIFLLTSRIEGFPMAILEAQQMGVVPIAMDSFPAIHDTIQDNTNGLLVPKNDVRALKEKIVYLMRNDSIRKTLCENGLSSSQRFSVKSVMNMWTILFNELQ